MKEKKKEYMKKICLILLPLVVVLMLKADSVQRKAPDVPYVPTPEKVVAKMLEMASVGKEDVLYDLGCGDGRIVITAAKELGCRGVGIDIDPQRIKESRENAANEGVEDRVEFRLMDLFEADIHPASVVTLYLLSSVNLRLRPTLLRDLKPGTRVVSHDFDMDSWLPDESVVLEIDSTLGEDPSLADEFFVDNYWNKHRVYFWIIPANVTGTWEWTLPAVFGKERFMLTLEQTFQQIRGKAFQGSSQIPLVIKGGTIMGHGLEFSLETKLNGNKVNLHFQGSATGNRMEGVMNIEGTPGSEEKWQAKRDPSTIEPIER
jgi:SAM-dependent methyltransferase